MRNRSVVRALGRVVVGVLAVAALGVAGEVPRPAPEFAINMPGGQPIQLSQYKGKVCALAFILTTCPHCQKTVGYLSAMQNEYGPRGFQALASAIDDMGAMLVPDFVKRFQPPFPVGFTPIGDAQAVLQHPAMLRMMMPQVMFIDRQGVIRAQFAGDDKFFETDQDKHIREQIETLLKEAPATHKKRAAAVKKAS